MLQPVELAATVEVTKGMRGVLLDDRERWPQSAGLAAAGDLERGNIVRSLLVVGEVQDPVLTRWPVKVEAAEQDSGARWTRQLGSLPCRRAVDEVIDSKTSLEEQEPVARTDQGVAPPAVFRGSRVLGIANVEAPAPRLVEGEERDGV
jgi:hypothetical protein